MKMSQVTKLPQYTKHHPTTLDSLLAYVQALKEAGIQRVGVQFEKNQDEEAVIRLTIKAD